LFKPTNKVTKFSELKKGTNC